MLDNIEFQSVFLEALEKKKRHFELEAESNDIKNRLKNIELIISGKKISKRKKQKMKQKTKKLKAEKIRWSYSGSYFRSITRR